MNSELIKNIYRLRDKFEEELDITLYGIDVIKTGIKTNSLLSLLFLNIFKNSNCLYKTDKFESFMEEMNRIAEKNKEFGKKYNEIGKTYSMVKDVMNSIKKNALLGSYSDNI